MLLSIGLIVLGGLVLGGIAGKLHLPKLVGMIGAGILIGPYVLGWLDSSMLAISSDIRRVALVIILTRAGLSLDLKSLKQVGRSAVMMCFIPASLEIAGTMLIAPWLLGVSLVEAAILGTVIAAVSPAVVVPRMIRLIETKWGTKKGIPQMIMAGASVDDVYVIVLFTAFCALEQGESVSVWSFASIPISILLGIALGVAAGLLFTLFYKLVKASVMLQTLSFLGIALLFLVLEDAVGDIVPIAGLLSVMAMGTTIFTAKPELAKGMSQKFNQLWVCAEIFLFVLVGATVNLQFAVSAGIGAIILVLLVQVFRFGGVQGCVIGTRLNKKERLFCGLAYMPKATVQAAIGGVPLAMGLACGNLVLTVAVLSILITAPVGAFLIDLFYQKLLQRE